jgi:hypothetical protein
MRANYCTFALILTLAACSGKRRPFADGPMEGLGGSTGMDAPAGSVNADASSGSEVEPGASGGEPLGGAPVVALSPPDDAVQSSGNLACEADAGSCTEPDAGPTSPTCDPGPRDCTSDLDNDCDGQPDNVPDDVCVCLPGAVEPCDEHPGLDGRGQCRAGSRTCIAAEGNVASDWGVCEGAQGPEEADSCAIAGDDANCDGTNNGECPCVDGDTQPCGPGTENGICQSGTQTCANGRFGGECVGAVFPGARNCGSSQDNNCDGRPDNTVDNVCTCTIGSVQACAAHPGRDGNGQCRAGSQTCEGRAGNSTSTFGTCTGSVGPLAQDSCAQGNDGTCNGISNEGCECINGATRQCGTTATGPCAFGTETCVNGRFGQCQGAVNPAPRNCASPQDNDCDGRPDNTFDNVCAPPECGDGVRNGSEACDDGRGALPEAGGCTPDCSGFYATKSIRRSLDIHGSNLGGIAGADAICQDDFGAGWKALIVGASRRATLSPFVGDAQLDWVLKRNTFYLNERDQLIWRTDSVALLGASGGQRQPLLAPIFDATPLNGGGEFPWSGYDINWTTTADTCDSWTVGTSRDVEGTFKQGSFITPDLAGIAVERCSETPYPFLLCVEQ